ncbi:MAG: hypothetical protein IPO88_23845 [Nannocystis sp.]|uniref:alginate O-acetyltransferase AlgX-related protein n=1 Tax=Nannocystis sp. TaxID=1962667 RepID=UPI002425F41D|nr:hypothetical protein [Nannocystis sp.]MBK9756473.1 hypothetical protein [Nannocystis sp.]
MSKSIDPSVKRRPLWRRALVISAQILIGTGLGAAASEYAFDRRDDGAFPHVNFYLPDPELGVRLEPGASMRFRLRENPVSTIHVNSRGFRGPEWPDPAPTDILVVGDSQVFGLGVDDDATFSARLAAASGRAVLNAGVPTYGPREYLATARELLAQRKLATVVVVLNFVNDPFELGRPNHERHAVWDGWAVRSETAPASVTDFPGRRWLFSRSHAVYALRRWLHERGSAAAPEAAELGTPLDLGTPSEGGLHNLVVASQSAHEEVARAQDEAAKALVQAKTRVASIDGEIDKARDELDALLRKASEYRLSYNDTIIARSRPGDIVEDDAAESSRSIVITAAMIREAARTRDSTLEGLLRAEEKRADKRPAHDLIAAEVNLAAERKRLREAIAAGIPPVPRPASQFRGYLHEFKALCDQHGAELVVVALPIDVQVDRGEWAKYGVADAPDMHDSLVLIDDLIADARALGLRSLDAVASLRAAEPDAFLDHDIHMTAKGHAALAEALAAALLAPVQTPMQGPRPGLPAGRSFVPTGAEWATAPEVVVKGSSALGCSTQIEREWLRIQCARRKPSDRLDGVAVLEGATPATMAMHSDDALSLVTPMTIGQPITARFAWKRNVRELQIRWPAGPDGKPQFTGAFVEPPPQQRADAAPPAHPLAAPIAGLCDCHRQLHNERVCADPDNDYYDGCPLACGKLWGDPRLAAACIAAFSKCEERLACAQNDPLFTITCPEGQVHAFASNACFPVCDPQHPCATGACTPWNEGSVCVPD